MAERCIICGKITNFGTHCPHEKHKDKFFCHECCGGKQGKVCKYFNILCRYEVEK